MPRVNLKKKRENNLGYNIKWSHVASENNIADVLTRSYMKSPGELPWSKKNMEINEDCLDMTKIPIQSLPDSDKKQILMDNDFYK